MLESNSTGHPRFETQNCVHYKLHKRASERREYANRALICLFGRPVNLALTCPNGLMRF